MSQHSATFSGTQPLRQLVDVRRRPTVVRLEHLDQQGSEWITEAYHLTPDVESHLSALAVALEGLPGVVFF